MTYFHFYQEVRAIFTHTRHQLLENELLDHHLKEVPKEMSKRSTETTE